MFDPLKKVISAINLDTDVEAAVVKQFQWPCRGNPSAGAAV
jgi:hypothetical protein